MKNKQPYSLRPLISLGLLAVMWFSFLPTADAAFSIAPGTAGQRQFSFEINPGEEKGDTVMVENLSNQSMNLHLYPADGTQSNQGTFALTTLDNPQINIGKWVTIAEPYVTLGGEEKKYIPFAVKVPAETPAGIYAGGIALEIDTSKDAQNGGVAVSSRMVVKLFVSVKGDKVFDVQWKEFSSGTVQQDPEQANTPPTINFKLGYENKGNTIVIIEQKIEITDGATATETLTLPNVTLLQSENITIPVVWKTQPLWGNFKAKTTATFYEFDSIKNIKTNPRIEVKEIELHYFPWEYLKTVGLAGIFVLFLILLGVSIQRIRSKSFRKTLVPYTVQPNDNLVSIAQKCNIKWQKLAKINNIKPPYSLQVGQNIFIPPSK